VKYIWKYTGFLADLKDIVTLANWASLLGEG